MRRWLRRRQEAHRLAQADAEALIRDHRAEAYREAWERERDVILPGRNNGRADGNPYLLRVRANVVTVSTTTKLARPPDPPPVLQPRRKHAYP
jgi:hypothetical protein